MTYNDNDSDGGMQHGHTWMQVWALRYTAASLEVVLGVLRATHQQRNITKMGQGLNTLIKLFYRLSIFNFLQRADGVGA
jgi:hypothetical protein